MSLKLYTDRAKHIVFAFDVSGGTEQVMLDEWFEMAKASLRGRTDVTLNLMTFDAQVRVNKRVTSNYSKAIDSIETPAGGGTLIGPIWQKMREEGMRPDLVVVFSDGFISDYSVTKRDNEQTLFVFSAHQSDVRPAPFGATIYTL